MQVCVCVCVCVCMCVYERVLVFECTHVCPVKSSQHLKKVGRIAITQGIFFFFIKTEREVNRK